MLRGVRGMLRHGKHQRVGTGTIKKLEAAGVTSIAQVAGMQMGELVELGIRKDFAKQIHRYVVRRRR